MLGANMQNVFFVLGYNVYTQGFKFKLCVHLSKHPCSIVQDESGPQSVPASKCDARLTLAQQVSPRNQKISRAKYAVRWTTSVVWIKYA